MFCLHFETKIMDILSILPIIHCYLFYSCGYSKPDEFCYYAFFPRKMKVHSLKKINICFILVENCVNLYQMKYIYLFDI